MIEYVCVGVNSVVLVKLCGRKGKWILYGWSGFLNRNWWNELGSEWVEINSICLCKICFCGVLVLGGLGIFLFIID